MFEIQERFPEIFREISHPSNCWQKSTTCFGFKSLGCNQYTKGNIGSNK